MQSPDNTEKKDAAHPKISVMVETAIKALAEPKGSSLKAIYKYIDGNYSVDIKKLSTFVKKYLKSAVEKGDLLQPKGKGASGSFKIPKQKPEPKPKVPKLKPPKTLKMQTSTPRKAKNPKKPGTKSPNKSPVKKVKPADGENAADSTFTKPKTIKAKKPKVSLPTKPRKSLTMPTKIKKPKKLMAHKAKEPKLSISPMKKLNNSVTSPKPEKPKDATKLKAKKSSKPAKANMIPKKAGVKKAPAKVVQK